MILYLQIFMVVLLGGVAGLLLALWFQLRDWRQSVAQAPLMAERLAEQLMAARKGLEELKRSVIAQAPELNQLLSEGGKLRVELQYLLQRAEKIGGNGEGKLSQTVKNAEAMVEEIAGANGQAIQSSHTAHDPLEDLLAGLQAEVEGLGKPVQRSARKRVGPVTQAEFNLQEKVNA